MSNDAIVTRAILKSPRIDWLQLHQWYQAVLNAGHNWRTILREDTRNPCLNGCLSAEHEAEVEADIAESSRHLRRTLLKATEALLRRPGRPLKGISTFRFLLLLLENPLLYSTLLDEKKPKEAFKKPDDISISKGLNGIGPSCRLGRDISRSHTGIIKRLLGLIANASPNNHRYLISWFAEYQIDDLKKLVDLTTAFVTQRLRRQRRSVSNSRNGDLDVLVPDLTGPEVETSAQLHIVLGTGPTLGRPRAKDGRPVYHDDWQIKAAAKVMLLFFQANNSSELRRHVRFDHYTAGSRGFSHGCHYISTQMRVNADALGSTVDGSARYRAMKKKRSLPTSAFYSTLLDHFDLINDFESWEKRQAGFSFCQYPMFLSIWAKIRILEYDARRQMEIKARHAFFNSIMSRRVISQYLVLRVRRQCLVEDSLRGVSEAVGSGQEDIKKGLRIAFQGEEGVDAGG